MREKKDCLYNLCVRGWFEDVTEPGRPPESVYVHSVFTRVKGHSHEKQAPFLRGHIPPDAMADATQLRVVGHMYVADIARHLEVGRGITVDRGALRRQLMSARISAMPKNRDAMDLIDFGEPPRTRRHGPL